MKPKTLILLMMIIIKTSNEYGNWNPHRRPKIMGDRLGPLKSLSPYWRRVQWKIVLYHNIFRSMVRPPASNMLKMKWHKGAAKAAQRWADECKFLVHDNITGRYIDNYGSCGQNIFIATHKVPCGNHPNKLNRPYKAGRPCHLCRNYCRKKLCLNGCPAANLWSNCDQLQKEHPSWLCHGKTPEGKDRSLYCKATCGCRNQIRD
ncbi:hypothetical protein NQ315_017596 [Exocentrus adspersus]|uniref:SCP domain-containing protein n=1 Tax=Exocentrus adspersus TaxID=1586481 RepID=A0AAV8V5N4_9CUCU|nr:hypothetical protein NQ315_017596 [Exocentrus adspersus]